MESIPKVSFKKPKTLFSKQNIAVGWSFTWRHTLLFLVPTTLLYIIFKNPQVLPVYCIVGLIISVFIHDLIGKHIFKKKYGIVINKFIGHKIMEREIVSMFIVGVIIEIVFHIPTIIMIVINMDNPDYSKTWSPWTSIYTILRITAYILEFSCQLPTIGWAAHQTLDSYIKQSGMSKSQRRKMRKKVKIESKKEKEK